METVKIAIDKLLHYLLVHQLIQFQYFDILDFHVSYGYHLLSILSSFIFLNDKPFPMSASFIARNAFPRWLISFFLSGGKLAVEQLYSST